MSEGKEFVSVRIPGSVSVFVKMGLVFDFCTMSGICLQNPTFLPSDKVSSCSETTLTRESRFHISTPLGIWTWVTCDGKQTGSPLDQWDMERMKGDCRLSTGLPPSSRLRRLWSWKGDLQWVWNQDRKAVWDQVGLSHCRHEGLVMIWDEAHLRRGHDDQSRRGHQCSETTLTGESRFHISTPLGIWTWVPCDRKQTGSPLDQWDMVRMKGDCRLSTFPMGV